MSKQMKKMLVIVLILFGIIFGWYGAKKIIFYWFMSHYTPPAVTISAQNATAKTWQSYISAVGTLTAVNGVDISSEASGIVKEIHFQSGQFVNEGDFLILLDTSIEDAQLKDNRAQLKLAQINYERDTTLLKKNALPQSSIDVSLAKLQQAEAGVQQIEARIKQKTITAPFSGKIGIRLIDIGDFVSAGTGMVTLQSLDPLFVRFNVPEQMLPNLYMNQPIDVEVNLSGNSFIRGTLTAINSKVDQTTRSILAQATIPNDNKQLYPGMYAEVKIWLREKKNVVTLPETAISYSLHGDSVFIIQPDGKDKKGNPVLKAFRRYVKIGERRGNEVAVLEGIKTGDSVVTSGQLKLQNGTYVVIDNSIAM